MHILLLKFKTLDSLEIYLFVIYNKIYQNELLIFDNKKEDVFY